jgi:hypothetical protein
MNQLTDAELKEEYSRSQSTIHCASWVGAESSLQEACIKSVLIVREMDRRGFEPDYHQSTIINFFEPLYF